MRKILDLHIHSKYSRACSPGLELPSIAAACEVRGINIVATSDFTHPAWFSHMQDFLIEDTSGIYKLKDGSSSTRFILGTELSCIKKHKNKTRRIHVCVFAPNLEVVEKFNNRLEEMGFNLKSDGRPILGLPVKELLKIMLEIDERMVMIPAHAWTPWFGIFGSKGGYDTLEEAFEELAPHIFAIETGLSSDPIMNWRLSMLDNITLISNSDAHSCAKLGREANVMQFNSDSEVAYDEIMRILRENDKEKFLYTIEFYPEEGKYHYDGHRDCKFVCAPDKTEKLKGICPKCKKPLVIGVENRVHELSDRSIEDIEKIRSKKIPYKSLVPLPEIIADVFGCGVNTKKVKAEYDSLIEKIGNEFYILIEADLKLIEKNTSKQIAIAVDRVRKGKIFVKPGYDGEFGIVKVFGDDKDRGLGKQV
ncbi:MAG: DNA helicase UvrD [Candidatus Magasanikbacteria bacterium]|nr:DNA helicase UvrD [Candidatus Magasanikbacteria bacterium]MBT4314598.1 DNA helicase UvrD [Candidatus Magasanikbacteria bacterium]MBT4546769.1 DNA helicase UvrD [Candidatus Magasanikbacteria bacterium]MBT6819622.1 DNA helicase UvrD [Candidatus Magasanikbacteria bacterium]